MTSGALYNNIETQPELNAILGRRKIREKLHVIDTSFKLYDMTEVLDFEHIVENATTWGLGKDYRIIFWNILRTLENNLQFVSTVTVLEPKNKTHSLVESKNIVIMRQLFE